MTTMTSRKFELGLRVRVLGYGMGLTTRHHVSGLLGTIVDRPQPDDQAGILFLRFDDTAGRPCFYDWVDERHLVRAP